LNFALELQWTAHRNLFDNYSVKSIVFPFSFAIFVLVVHSWFIWVTFYLSTSCELFWNLEWVFALQLIGQCNMCWC